MPLGIGLEEAPSFADEGRLSGDDTETAAVLNVGVSQIEGQQIQIAVIDDHHLAVVSGKVVGGARYSNAGGQEPHFEASQTLFAGAVGMSYKCMNGNSAAHGIRQSSFDFSLLKTEDDDFDIALCGFDRPNQRPDSITRLYQQSHRLCFLNLST
jgi:hypothetical protein